MARALGSNALSAAAFETTYGVPPGSGFKKMPLVSSNLGETRGLIDSDLLGYGREPTDPITDVADNDGDMVVPVDVLNFGWWLKLFMGAPTTTPGTPNVHVFNSGAAALPSMALEVGFPDVPSYGMNYGVRGNTMKIDMARSGLLNATLGLIAQGESIGSSSAAGTPTTMAVTRFAQATGAVKKDGTALGSVVGASFTYSNNLEKVEVIRSDGRIEDADPGLATLEATVTVRFKDTTLLAAAAAGTPMDLSFGWTSGSSSLIFDAPRVFLPTPKRPVSGPRGVQAEFAVKGSGQGGHVLTATLTNSQATYA